MCTIAKTELLGLVLALLSAFSATSDAAVPYTITDLGTFGGAESQAYGINNAGQVVGQATMPNGDRRAFLWEDGVKTDLGTLGGAESEAWGINDTTQVVGWSDTADYPDQAFLWDDGVMTPLLTPTAQTSYGLRINNAGQVVGYTFGLGGIRAFIWENGVATDLGTLDGDTPAYGINGAGQVVGASEIGFPGSPHAFVWENGVMTDLGTPNSLALDINNAEQIVGGAYPFGPPLLWDNGTPIQLGPSGTAYAINELGQVVGGTGSHAFIWENGVLTDLNELIPPEAGWTLEVARDLNDLGQIVGWGTAPNGETHGYLLTPIPEPDTVLFLALSACMVARRRRQ